MLLYSTTSMTRGILHVADDEWNKKISSCAAEVLIAVLYVQYVCMYVCMAGVWWSFCITFYYKLHLGAGPV